MKDATKSIEERIDDIGEQCNKCGNNTRYVVEIKTRGWPVEIFLNTCNMYQEKWPDVYIIPNLRRINKTDNTMLVGPLTCGHK